MAGVPFLPPTTSRGPGSAFAHRCVSLSSNSTAPRVRVRCSWLGQWRYNAGDIPRCFHRLSPLCGFPQWHPPQRTMSPRATAHTGHQMCADTVSPPSCLPHPDPLVALAFLDRELAAARPTWTATHAACTSARACRCSASFAWCAALPSSSPSKPSALDHTDAAHPKCERSHSLFHPASPSVPLARAHRNLGCSKKGPVVTGSAPLGRLSWA